MRKYLHSIMKTESCCKFTVSELQTDFLYLKNKCEEHNIRIIHLKGQRFLIG